MKVYSGLAYLGGGGGVDQTHPLIRGLADFPPHLLIDCSQGFIMNIIISTHITLFIHPGQIHTEWFLSSVLISSLD